MSVSCAAFQLNWQLNYARSELALLVRSASCVLQLCGNGNRKTEMLSQNAPLSAVLVIALFA